MRHRNTLRPWGTAFTALLLIYTLNGCRQTPKPAPPTMAWVRVENLLPYHPNRQMLEDLDRRLAALATQRACLQTRPALTAPAETMTQAIPPLVPMPAPAPPNAPTPPPPSLMTRNERALRQDQAYRWQRDYLRQQRRLSDAYARQLQAKLMRLEEDADADRCTIGEKYRTRLVNAELRRDMAQRQLREQQDYLTNHPANSNALHLVESGEQHLHELETAYTQLHADYEGEMQKSERELAALKKTTAAENQRALQAELQQLKTQLAQNAEKAVAAAPHPPVAEDGQEAIAMAAEPTFPEVPATATQLGTDELVTGTAAANRTHQRDTQSAVAAIDRSIALLRKERAELLQSMWQETQAAAVSVAAQHGYRVIFTGQRGKNATADVARWLQEYWRVRQVFVMNAGRKSLTGQE